VNVLKEFREFAVRGNVVDMAVGIIIGAAFGKIVSSLVADVITPPIGLMIGGIDFSHLAFTLKAGPPAVVVSYGKFLQQVFDFAIVAFAIFLLVKGINHLKRHHEAKEAAKEASKPLPGPTKSEELLTEIRDLLKKQQPP
jgi:large conductance mechanosensitive channel